MKFFRRHWPSLTLLLIWLLFTYKYWLKGLIPAPLDLLVGFFSPWQPVYNVPIKNPAIPDVVNQIIPWKLFTISQWQKAIVPLWNPYNFAGNPHAANWQSAVFYPFNLLMIFLGFINGWSIYILSQPLLAGMFTYLFARQLKLSRPSALLSALSFSFCGFITSWLEWGTLGHAILWLPASLWVIEKYISSRRPKYLVLNSLFLSLSLLAGHLQISLYVIITSLAYYLYRFKKPIVSQNTLLATVFYSLSFLLIGFQLFPTLELYFHSLRAQALSWDWFQFFRIPPEQLVTFLAPDFFGNPATGNHWGNGSYVEMMAYIGVIPLVFSLSPIISLGVLRKTPGGWNSFKPRERQVRFFIWLIIVSLVFALKIPTSNLLFWLRLPVFASSSPARIIGLVSFSLSLLAGIGLDLYITKSDRSKLYLSSFVTAAALLLLWLATFLLVPPEHAWVARRNLILPTATLILFIGGASLLNHLNKIKFFSKKTSLILHCLFIILLAAGDLFRFHHKYTPYSPGDYFYPTFGIRQKLASLANHERVFGLFSGNLNLPFKFFSPEGYDPLHLKSYAELVSAHSTGKINLPERSSAITIKKNEAFTMALLNLLNAKFVIQPTVHGAAPWELHLWEYPDQFKLLYDDGNFQIFQNKRALSRFFLTNNFAVSNDKQQTIDALFQQKDQRVFLASQPNVDFSPSNNNASAISLLNYQPNQVDFAVNSQQPTLLYLSDSWYPGWKASIDGSKSEILKANLAFRAMVIPAGNHQVSLQYRPVSFTIGLGVSLLALISLVSYASLPIHNKQLKA